MAEVEIIRSGGALPHARPRGFWAFCALLAVLILGLLGNPFSASADRRAETQSRVHRDSGQSDRGTDTHPAAAAVGTDTHPAAAAVGTDPTSGGSASSAMGVVPAETMQRLLDAAAPIYCGAGTEPLVALTFDDGPGVNTRTTIDLLKQHDMTATFFTVGKLYHAAPGWADLLKVEAKFGAVGDHTWDHVAVNEMSTSQLDEQILRTRREAEKLSGKPVFLFRPPLGARSDALDRYVDEQGMLQIMWSIDSGDSQGARYDEIYNTIKEHLSPGDIILLHEGRGTTQNALPMIFQLIEDRGYTTVTVPQLLAMDPPTDQQLRQHSCSA
jgi:peptidoglycan-N-acetylglucosamine deacetylase